MVTEKGDPDIVARDLHTVDGVATGLYVSQQVSAPMRAWLLRFDAEALAHDRMIRALYGHPMVQLAQNNHVVEERNVPNDAQYAQQWHHQNINSETAWGISTGGVTATGDTIVVCIIERADLPHPDLIGNAWFNRAEIPGNGIDDDGNGYVDDYRGWNPPSNNDAVYSGSHGTQVAGMIGAKGNNSAGVVGANWDVKMMVVNYGGTSESQVLAAYTYPLVMRRMYNMSNGQHGAFVVATNASWGVNNGQPANAPLWCAMYDTLGTAGILNCGATSNSNVNVDVVGDLPTACPSDFMVSVTATNTADNRTFSAFGLTTIDVGAPGDNVRTTNQGGGYGTTSGTSFASPLTAGVIGLLYSAPCASLMGLVQSNPREGALYVRQMLFQGVDIVGNLQGQTVTGGRINAGNSMNLIMANCSACPSPTNGTVTAPTAGQARFTWNSFAGGPFNVRYREVGATDWNEVSGVDGNVFETAGIDVCTAYEFQVETLCAEEGSGYSNSAVLNPPNVPVPAVTINGRDVACASDPVVLSTSSPGALSWSNGQSGPSITVQESGSYTVTATGPCNAATSAAVSITVLDPQAPVAADVVIPGPGTAQLEANSSNVLWYAAPTGGAPLGAGSPWETPFLNNNTTFWASAAEDSPTTTAFGGATARSTTGQFHTNASFWLLFTANQPFVIRSVKVYANGAGSRPIGLVNTTTNAVVAQGNYSIPNGESRVQLNMVVPAAGTYALRVMSGDPQLWRDGIGSNPTYPYPLGTLGAITSSSATGTNATALYYFFYDWEVETLGITCESERVPVNVDLLTTGLEEVEGGDALQVFPNPANDRVVLVMPGGLTAGMVQIMDSKGALVREHRLIGERTELSMQDVPTGLYAVRVLAMDGAELGRSRLVIAR